MIASLRHRAFVLAIVLTGLATATASRAGIEPPVTLVGAASPAEGAADTAAVDASRHPDPAALETYIDGIVDSYRQRDGIAGISVAVVDRDGPLLMKGYGIASQDPQRAVSPQDTRFRIGSVSKTFAYLLATSLLDAGELDLDTPINQYLPADLQLPDDGFDPVLLRHLLTHTAGYEDSALGHLIVDKPERSPSLHDYLLRHRPARVRQPGLHAVYSNYSLALLGAVLANVSGLPFETLAEQRLFTPMGMHDTSFREPRGDGDARDMPGASLDRWSVGFGRRNGGFKAEGFEFIGQLAPAGSVSSTAGDMARYLRMLLNNGELDGQQIVPAAVFDRLQGEPLFRTAEGATGFAYGFFRRRYGEVFSLEHGGATLYFHTNLVAVPELGIGIFVSTNTNTGVRLAAELPEHVLEHFYERARGTASSDIPVSADQELGEYAGDYLTERRAFIGFEKLLSASNARIAANADGYLVLSAGGDSSRWLPVSKDVFRHTEGQGQLVFLRNDDGLVSGFVSPRGHIVYDRGGSLDDPQTFYLYLGLATLAALGVLTGAWLRRRKPRPDTSAGRWLAWTALAWLLFVLAFALALLQIQSAGDAAVFAYPAGLLRIALWLSLPALLLTAASTLMLMPAWRSGDYPLWRKLRHTLALLAFVLAACAVWAWNVVGWKL